MKIRNLKFLVLCTLLLFIKTASAQEMVLKSNLLYVATGTPNIEFEVATGKKHSLAMGLGILPWKYGENKQLRHWSVQPEFRYWPCETFNGHFWGIHLMGGQFNAGGVKLPFGLLPSIENRRYQGWGAGGGLTYGYHWMLDRRWSLEFALGLGYIYTNYKRYRCSECGKVQAREHKNYVGPTKAAINLIYSF